MKKNYLFKLIFAFLFVSLLHLQLNGQVRIVQVDPASDTITIHNFGVSTVDISSYWFCSLFSYIQLNSGSLTIVTGSLNLNSNSEVIISGFSLNNSAADLGLYSSSTFGSTSAMQDFTQWGSANNGRENVAVTKGIWSAGTFISDPPPFEYTGNGSQNGVSFWGTVLGIDDVGLKDFSISPNPARSSLFVNLPMGLREVSVEIFDILGKEIYTNKFSQAPINISNWSKGVYLVRVSSDNAVHTKRFIKQ